MATLMFMSIIAENAITITDCVVTELDYFRPFIATSFACVYEYSLVITDYILTDWSGIS